MDRAEKAFRAAEEKRPTLPPPPPLADYELGRGKRAKKSTQRAAAAAAPAAAAAADDETPKATTKAPKLSKTDAKAAAKQMAREAKLAAAEKLAKEAFQAATAVLAHARTEASNAHDALSEAERLRAECMSRHVSAQDEYSVPNVTSARTLFAAEELALRASLQGVAGRGPVLAVAGGGRRCRRVRG